MMILGFGITTVYGYTMIYPYRAAVHNETMTQVMRSSLSAAHSQVEEQEVQLRRHCGGIR